MSMNICASNVLFIHVKKFFPTLGPRFVFNLIKVFEGSFGGSTLYENPKYVTPNAVSTCRMLVLGCSMQFTFEM